MRQGLAFLFAVLLPCVAQARLGETAEQLATRFGEPVASEMPLRDGFAAGMTQINYTKQGFAIVVTMADPSGTGVASIAVSELYIAQSPLTQDQIQALLAANGEGKTWKKEPPYAGNSYWIHGDGAKAALENGDSNMRFESKFFVDKRAAFQAAQRRAATPDTSGF